MFSGVTARWSAETPALATSLEARSGEYHPSQQVFFGPVIHVVFGFPYIVVVFKRGKHSFDQERGVTVWLLFICIKELQMLDMAKNHPTTTNM
jgi:hypothetical protein